MFNRFLVELKKIVTFLTSYVMCVISDVTYRAGLTITCYCKLLDNSSIVGTVLNLHVDEIGNYDLNKTEMLTLKQKL